MTRSTVFTSKRSQAVRLPKAVAFPPDVHQVEIIKIGHGRLVSPVGRRWDDLFLGGRRASDDFMSEQPDIPLKRADGSDRAKSSQ
ncbi:MAG: type II toxin-antitoxin system VapB family antitoxin [Xanthobacteraceae bacterium]